MHSTSNIFATSHHCYPTNTAVVLATSFAAHQTVCYRCINTQLKPAPQSSTSAREQAEKDLRDILRDAPRTHLIDAIAMTCPAPRLHSSELAHVATAAGLPVSLPRVQAGTTQQALPEWSLLAGATLVAASDTALSATPSGVQPLGELIVVTNTGDVCRQQVVIAPRKWTQREQHLYVMLQGGVLPVTLSPNEPSNKL